MTPALTQTRPTAIPANTTASASARAASNEAEVLKGWRGLTPGQRGLFGEGAAAQQTYRALSSEQRAIFLFLTRRLEENGMDLTGLRLEDPVKTIRPNRILLEPGPALERFEAQLQAGKEEGTWQDDSPFAPFHWGRADVGARESRRKWSLQIGVGEKGAFVDVDRYNPWAGFSAFWGHTAELLIPGKPDADNIARELGTPIFRGQGRRDWNSDSFER